MPDDQDCAPGLIVSAAKFPYGLRCGECSRPLEPGDRYAESLTGMAGDIPVVKVVCVPCDEGQHTASTG
jgi:hypothetical protein